MTVNPRCCDPRKHPFDEHDDGERSLDRYRKPTASHVRNRAPRRNRWVIIVSADKWNQCLRNQLVSIVPITSLSPGHQPREDEVLLDPLDTGLKVRSVTSCNQHLSVDRLRLGAKIGQIPDRKMRQITSCLAAVFGLEAYW